MTTRAGLAGLLTGLAVSILTWLFFAGWPDAYPPVSTAGSALYPWINACMAGLMVVGGGFWAGRRSGSGLSWRCAALGGLCGGLAGTILFCLWGAAAAGLLLWAPPPDQQPMPVAISSTVLRQTMGMFLVLFVSGGGFGALGGWLACPRRRVEADRFNKADPQMALNGAITALPAAIVAAVLAAGIFSRLADLWTGQTGGPVWMDSTIDSPLVVALLLVLISHLALMQVVPHETQQFEHLCGLDEVKMAAYVSIAAAPVLLGLLLLVDSRVYTQPLVILALLAVTGMSLKSLRDLLRLVLPKRASFPPPENERQKAEAIWFGTIANSHGPRLVVLCVGCGLVMVLPLYVCVAAPLINLTGVLADSSRTVPALETLRQLFLTQALASLGMIGAAIAALTGLYLFYLNLGRWFKRWNSRRTG